jgi:hypothetical protein
VHTISKSIRIAPRVEIVRRQRMLISGALENSQIRTRRGAQSRPTLRGLLKGRLRDLQEEGVWLSATLPCPIATSPQRQLEEPQPIPKEAVCMKYVVGRWAADRYPDLPVVSSDCRCARGNRCRPSWTLRFPDPQNTESAIPFSVLARNLLALAWGARSCPLPFREADQCALYATTQRVFCALRAAGSIAAETRIRGRCRRACAASRRAS